MGNGTLDEQLNYIVDDAGPYIEQQQFIMQHLVMLPAISMPMKKPLDEKRLQQNDSITPMNRFTQTNSIRKVSASCTLHTDASACNASKHVFVACIRVI